MNHERFLALPAEKQSRIVNAGFKVFGENDYRHASTDQIAAEAGISKGYLFYYFRNKQEFYLYLNELAVRVIRESVVDPKFSQITDFFELLEYAALRKYEMAAEHPHLFTFSLRAFQSQKEEVSEELGKRFQSTAAEAFAAYFGRVDFSRFREGVDPVYLLRMLTWMGDGYLAELRRSSQPVRLAPMMEDFRKWMGLFKRLAYKEEYL